MCKELYVYIYESAMREHKKGKKLTVIRREREHVRSTANDTPLWRECHY